MVMNALALPILLAGFTSQASIIVAVGAQNAFIIRQGIMRSHIPQIIAICIGADAVLISLGTQGMGSMVMGHPVAMKALTWLGAAMLFAYGIMAFMRVARRLKRVLPSWQMQRSGNTANPAAVLGFSRTAAAAASDVDRNGQALLQSGSAAGNTTSGIGDAQPSLKSALLMCLGFTFLNPGVYLDTIVLLGGLAATYGETLKWSFAVGAIMCSVVWFVLLGTLSTKMSRLFTSNRAWLVLDTIIGITMVLLSVHLVLR